MPLDLRHRSVRAVGAMVVVVLAALLAAAPIAAEPLADSDATVTALRREADRAASEYFDALGRSQALDQRIADLEQRLPGLAAQRRELRTHAEQRAVEAYKRSGSHLGAIMASQDAMTAARRVTWLEQLNARDNATFAELAAVTHQLETERSDLRTAQASQQQALATLEAQGLDISAKLQAAEDRARQQAAQRAARAATPRPVNPPSGPGGAPPGPPPDYQPTPGTHPHHDDPFLVCTRAHEGSYTSYNPAGPYMGAYQFLQSTWNSAANRAGRPELIGVPPHTASEYDQDDVAWALYQSQGARPWGGRCA